MRLTEHFCLAPKIQPALDNFVWQSTASSVDEERQKNDNNSIQLKKWKTRLPYPAQCECMHDTTYFENNQENGQGVDSAEHFKDSP